MNVISTNVFYSNSNITGLSSVKDNFEFSLTVPAGVTFTLSTGTVSLQGYHDIDLGVSSGTYWLTGFGDYQLKIVNLDFGVDVKILINLLTNKFNITKFSLDLGGDELAVNLGETLINDEPIEWDIINKNVNCFFQIYWPYLKNLLIDPLLKTTLNELLKVRIKSHFNVIAISS